MAVDKRIQGIRVYVDGKSREIQKKLFELGAEWKRNGQEITDEEYPFVYVDAVGVMACGWNMKNFKKGGYRGNCPTEVKADELLSWEPQPQLKPFQKVLVRGNDDDEWRASIFSHCRRTPYARTLHYVCMQSIWTQCIPYEGNEHLLGTTDKPNKEAQ